MNFKFQFFPKGHQYYTEKTITNTDTKKGVVGTFRIVFGQIVTESGNFVCYCFQRGDKRTPEGTYPYTIYFSPANNCDVLLLHDVPGAEYEEVHIANYPYELKGCTAPCIEIDLKTPMGVHSGMAFKIVMGLVGQETGTITFETLK